MGRSMQLGRGNTPGIIVTNDVLYHNISRIVHADEFFVFFSNYCLYVGDGGTVYIIEEDGMPAVMLFIVEAAAFNGEVPNMAGP